MYVVILLCMQFKYNTNIFGFDFYKHNIRILRTFGRIQQYAYKKNAKAEKAFKSDFKSDAQITVSFIERRRKYFEGFDANDGEK